MTRAFTAARVDFSSLSRRHLVMLVMSCAAVIALCIGAQLVPSTSSGYTVRIGNSTNTVSTLANFTCSGAIAVDKSTAMFEYPLSEATNSTTAVDSYAAPQNGTYQGTMTSARTTPIACPRDAGGAYVLNGTSSYVTNPTLVNNPTTFSIEVWFKTTVASGKLIGFGSAPPTPAGAGSATYDRHLYVATTGQIVFGVFPNTAKTIISPQSYTDGKWHQAVATFSAGSGMLLYMDGKAVASDPTTTTAQNIVGFWRVGFDNQGGWPSVGSDNYFTGSMRFAGVYTSVLTAAQIANHYNASLGS